jgi:hypothetical protein
MKSEMQVIPRQIDTARVVFSPNAVPLGELECVPMVLLAVDIGCAGLTVVDV